MVNLVFGYLPLSKVGHNNQQCPFLSMIFGILSVFFFLILVWKYYFIKHKPQGWLDGDQDGKSWWFFHIFCFLSHFSPTRSCSTGLSHNVVLLPPSSGNETIKKYIISNYLHHWNVTSVSSQYTMVFYNYRLHPKSCVFRFLFCSSPASFQNLVLVTLKKTCALFEI